MDALMASYASDTDSDGGESASVSGGAPEVPEPSALLPPPPLDLLQPPNFVDYSAMAQGGRVRSFPHVEGNYAVHVYIPGLRFCLLVLLQMLLFFDVNVHLEINIKYICCIRSATCLLGVFSGIRISLSIKNLETNRTCLEIMSQVH